MSSLRDWLLAALLSLGAILLAFLGGRQRGGAAAKQAAEDKAEAERHRREAEAAKATVEAVKSRLQTAEKINQMEPNDVRKDLSDRWSRD